MDTLTGSVERITYYNSENGYSVVRLRPEHGRPPSASALSRDGLVTITGNLPELSPGEHVRLNGRWTTHAQHGLQFQAEFCEQTMPATVSGIRRYLGSGLIKGIGPRLAERIVAKFGAKTLDVIEKEPEKLRQVADIGPKRARQILSAWEEQKHVKEIMLFLHSYGVSTNLAIKIYKQYGDQALETVRNDPYRLARDIYGVGFKTADKIAQAMGLAPDHPSRVEAGIIYVLNELSDEGHVFALRPALVERTSEMLSLPPDLFGPALTRLEDDSRVRQDYLAVSEGGEGSRQPAASVREAEAGYAYILPRTEPAVYLASFYHTEVSVAERFQAIAAAPPQLKACAHFIPTDLNLSSEQQDAVHMALTHPLTILTGGPGTGKTTTLKALILALESGRKTYALASPTGRAAKRLSEATGRPASTIHRLLGPSPAQGFKLNASNPLTVDMIVLDEASMLDMMLANHLLKAIRPGTHLLLIGDVDQLPSVGAGDVLRDVISSGAAPVTRLSIIFRQAADSLIITNAHRINQGQMPIFPASSGENSDAPGDFFLFPAETPQDAAHWVQEVVCNRIPRKFGLHPRDEVQVLAPMYRGEVGVHALNERLQAVLNPPETGKTEKPLFGQHFRVGDKVMQIRNNYDKDVYNGEIGSLFGIDLVEHTLTVSLDGRAVTYDWTEADQLVLAYAISVHKFQGSEFPAVVIPLVTQHYMMLQRNLLYTAVTRARKLCVLVGSRRAVGMAVRNNQVAERNTALDRRMRSF